MTARPPTAQELVDEYKRAGHFDELRTSILERLLDSEAGDTLNQRVDEITENTLRRSDNILDRRSTDRLVSMVRNELQRYPVVERAMGYVKEEILKDDEVLDDIRSDLEEVLKSLKDAPPDPDSKDAVTETSEAERGESDSDDDEEDEKKASQSEARAS